MVKADEQLQPAAIPQLAALRHPEYRKTWYASMYSGAAMWTFIVATGWLVFEQSGSSEQSRSSTLVGLVTFASMVPSLVVSPIGGLIGDVYDRRNVSLIAFLFSATLVGTLAALAIADQAQVWRVAALAFALGVVRNVREPSMQALVPNQVPKEDLLNALVLSGASRHGARFFGLLVAAPLLTMSSIGVNGVLVLSAVFHVLGAVQMARIATVSSGQTRPEHGIVRSMVDGLMYIYSNHAMALFVVLVAFHCALVMSFESILPVLSEQRLGATDARVFNYLMMGFGAGSLVGMAGIAGIRDERRKGQLLVLTGLASGVTPMMLAAAGSLQLAVLFSAAMGASQATFMALTNTYVQVMAPDRLRARISSLYVLHAGGIMAFSNLGYGVMADAFSAPPILVVTGALFLVVIASLVAGQPILRQVYRTGQVAAT